MKQRLKQTARILFPSPLHTRLRLSYQAVRKWNRRARPGRRIRYFGFARYCPICSSQLRMFLPSGDPVRPNAKCPICGANERHRLIYLYLIYQTDLFSYPKKRMLHAAPADSLSNALKDIESISYITSDLSSYAMLEMDLTEIYFPDETFDAIVASHVLEHIPDDRKAMREIFRVLKPGGWAILEVPMTNRETTYEDDRIVEPLERKRAFGQIDHVRLYGQDYYARLEEAGFKVVRERMAIQDDPRLCRKLGVSTDKAITLCVKKDDGHI